MQPLTKREWAILGTVAVGVVAWLSITTSKSPAPKPTSAQVQLRGAIEWSVIAPNPDFCKQSWAGHPGSLTISGPDGTVVAAPLDGGFGSHGTSCVHWWSATAPDLALYVVKFGDKVVTVDRAHIGQTIMVPA